MVRSITDNQGCQRELLIGFCFTQVFKPTGFCVTFSTLESCANPLVKVPNTSFCDASCYIQIQVDGLESAFMSNSLATTKTSVRPATTRPALSIFVGIRKTKGDAVRSSKAARQSRQRRASYLCVRCFCSSPWRAWVISYAAPERRCVVMIASADRKCLRAVQAFLQCLHGYFSSHPCYLCPKKYGRSELCIA